MNKVPLRTFVLAATFAFTSVQLFHRFVVAEDSKADNVANNSSHEIETGDPIEISIPLSSIVTTSPQEGTQHIGKEFPQKNGDRLSKSTNGYLQQIFHASKGGASNLFLVDAVNAPAAIAASLNVLVGSRPAAHAVPVNTPDPPRGSHWLVVYLGSGPSSPTSWKVETTKVMGNTVTFNYRKATLSPATADVVPYYYWVPLSKLSPGFYEVKLVDADLRATTLMRRVEVSP